jgi:hypothetical protein
MKSNPLIYEKFIERNKYIHANGKLENGLMYLYQAYQFNVINASTTYTNKNHEPDRPLLLIESTFTSNEKVIEHFFIHSMKLDD